MNNSSGEISFPIWLLLNPKYPSVHHSIWTPTLDEIQDKIYREIETRIETTDIYIRNAINDCGKVPNTLNWWAPEVMKEIEFFRENVLKNKPIILITFGAFPFEFARRVFTIKPEKGPKYWSNSNLESQFNRSIENFDIKQTNLIPLLRQVSVNNSNYFRDMGIKIAEKIVENKDGLKIFIK